MKICIVAPINPYVSCGATNNVIGFKEGLEKNGHTVFLIGFRKVIGEGKPDEKDMESKNITLVPYYNIVPRKHYGLRDMFDRRWQHAATGALKKICAREQIDIVFVRYAYYPYFTIKGIRKEFKGKIAVLSHPIFTAHLSVTKLSKRLAEQIREYERLSLEECDKVLSYSPISTKIITREYGIKEDKTAMTIAGVDTGRFGISKNRKEEMGWEGRFVIGYMGSIASWQGLDYMIKAIPAIVEKNKDALLAVIGPCSDAGYKRVLERQIDELSMREHVKFYEPVCHDDVPYYLNSFDVFVAPYAKNRMQSTIFPIKCAEALVAGCRIVTTDQPGLSWIIKDGDNGLLAETNSARSLAEKIIMIMEDPALAERLSKNAKKCGNRFDWKIIAKEAVEAVMKE